MLKFSIFSVILQNVQFVLHQILWLVHSQNSTQRGFAALFSILFSFFDPTRFSLHSFPTKLIQFELVWGENMVRLEHLSFGRLLLILVWVEEVAADEGGIAILGVSFSIFIWAVEGSVHISPWSLIVNIEYSLGGSFRNDKGVLLIIHDMIMIKFIEEGLIISSESERMPTFCFPG